MRYSITLPLALAAFTASPVIAQEAPPAPTAQTEPGTDAETPPPVETAPPPVDSATPPAPRDETTPPVPATSPAAAPATAAPAAAPTASPAPAPATAAPAAAPTTPRAPATAAAAVAAPKAKLTAEQKVAYDAWPTGTKSYFGGLTEARQTLFLRLTDTDKAKLVALDASQQETVWASIEKQDGEQKAKTSAK